LPPMKIGGVSVVRDLKAAKKPYAAPCFEVLDAAAAKVELEAIGASSDVNARQMRSVIKEQIEKKTAHPPRSPLS
jgi:hypothetical protein